MALDPRESFLVTLAPIPGLRRACPGARGWGPPSCPPYYGVKDGFSKLGVPGRQMHLLCTHIVFLTWEAPESPISRASVLPEAGICWPQFGQCWYSDEVQGWGACSLSHSPHHPGSLRSHLQGALPAQLEMLPCPLSQACPPWSSLSEDQLSCGVEGGGGGVGCFSISVPGTNLGNSRARRAESLFLTTGSKDGLSLRTSTSCVLTGGRASGPGGSVVRQP